MARRQNEPNEDERLNYKGDDFDQIEGAESALGLDKELISKLPRATHTGELKIGEAVFKCAVLEDGTRVLTQQTFSQALGRSGNLRERISSDADVVPPF